MTNTFRKVSAKVQNKHVLYMDPFHESITGGCTFACLTISFREKREYQRTVQSSVVMGFI